jgi:hypothetical protein
MKKFSLNTITVAMTAALGLAQHSLVEPIKRRIGRSRTAYRMHTRAVGFMATMGLIAFATSYNVWSNAHIDIQDNTPTAQVISGISKANPAVVTYVGADPANGDFVTLSDIIGMVELNDQVFRIANVIGGSNTFELEGVDSTAFATFVSGNMSPLTFGVTMTTVQDVNSGGGEFQFADLTTIHDTLQKRIPTTASPFTMTLGCLFKPEDAAHIELEQANDTKSVRAIKVRWATGAKACWLAYVGASGIPTGQAQGVVKTNVNFEGQGKPRFYAS